MSKAIVSVRIALIKKNTITLRAQYQIPRYLAKLILDIDKNTSIEYISDLILLTNMYMRVKGFYKKFPQFEEIYKQEIVEYFKKKEVN